MELNFTRPICSAKYVSTYLSKACSPCWDGRDVNSTGILPGWLCSSAQYSRSVYWTTGPSSTAVKLSSTLERVEYCRRLLDRTQLDWTQQCSSRAVTQFYTQGGLRPPANSSLQSESECFDWLKYNSTWSPSTASCDLPATVIVTHVDSA